MAERPRTVVIQFPHLTAGQERSLIDMLEDAMMHWSFDHPVTFAMGVTKPSSKPERSPSAPGR